MTPSISSSSFVAAEGKRIQIDVDVRRTCEEEVPFFLTFESKKEKKRETTTTTTRNYNKKLRAQIIFFYHLQSPSK